METKSRYEVIAEMEEKKRDFIVQRDGADLLTWAKKKEIKNLKRQLEDKEEELVEFIKQIDARKATLDILIEGMDDTLSRFGNPES